MVNYGNSKALVAVNEPVGPGGQLSSAPLLNSARVRPAQERPTNPGAGQ